MRPLASCQLAFGIFTYWSVRRYVVDVNGASMTHRAKQIAQTLLGPGEIDEGNAATEIELRYAPELNDRFIRITRSDGKVLYYSRNLADSSFTRRMFRSRRPKQCVRRYTRNLCEGRRKC